MITLWQQHSFRHGGMAFCLASFFGIGIAQWLPTFFIRSYGMEISEIGAWFALTWGVGGMLGTYLGGALVSRYAVHKEALQMRVLALICGICGTMYVMVYLSANKYSAVAFMAIIATLFAMFTASVFSMIQSLVTDRMRSVALAVTFLLANLIGFGFGPVAVGVISDLLAPRFGQESLRYALMLFSPSYLWLAYHYWKAGSTIENDIRQVELNEENMEPKEIRFEAMSMASESGRLSDVKKL